MSVLEAIQHEATNLPAEAEFEKRQLLSSMCVELGRAKAQVAVDYTLELIKAGCNRNAL